MKTKELYVCEICGAEYDTESKAIACEEHGHTKIEQIRYEYLKHGNIPTKVILKVADRDCSVAVYKFLKWRDV